MVRENNLRNPMVAFKAVAWGVNQHEMKLAP